MTLVNCKISNYPLGEPDNQNPSYAMGFGNSVINNSLPSHVKLIIKPNNDVEDLEGFYAVRATDFWIGGRENYLDQATPLDASLSTHNGYFYEYNNYGAQPWFVYEISNASYFSTDSDLAISQVSIDNYLSSNNIGTYHQWKYNFGLGYSPLSTNRNGKSIELFGEITQQSPGRIYHYCGHDSSFDDIAMDDLDFMESSDWGITPLRKPPFLVGNNPQYWDANIFSEEGIGTNNIQRWELYLGKTWPSDAAWPPTLDDIQQNKGYEKTTSWTHINRIMICDSLPSLGEAQDEDGIQIDENYPINNEVHVWIEFKDDYALDILPENNPETWDIKVDIDGAAKYIEY